MIFLPILPYTLAFLASALPCSSHTSESSSSNSIRTRERCGDVCQECYSHAQTTHTLWRAPNCRQMARAALAHTFLFAIFAALLPICTTVLLLNCLNSSFKPLGAHGGSSSGRRNTAADPTSRLHVRDSI